MTVQKEARIPNWVSVLLFGVLHILRFSVLVNCLFTAGNSWYTLFYPSRNSTAYHWPCKPPAPACRRLPWRRPFFLESGMAHPDMYTPCSVCSNLHPAPALVRPDHRSLCTFSQTVPYVSSGSPSLFQNQRSLPHPPLFVSGFHRSTYRLSPCNFPMCHSQEDSSSAFRTAGRNRRRTCPGPPASALWF